MKIKNILLYSLKKGGLLMEELLIEPVGETSWYENDQPIQEFLESYKNSAILKEDYHREEPSWLKIVGFRIN